MDKWTMMFQLAMVTKYSEDFLLNLPQEKLEELYKIHVEKRAE